MKGLPNLCACGTPISQLWHDVQNERFLLHEKYVEDVTAQILKAVFQDLTVEPMLYKTNSFTANTFNDAHVDVSDINFWTYGQKANLT